VGLTGVGGAEYENRAVWGNRSQVNVGMTLLFAGVIRLLFIPVFRPIQRAFSPVENHPFHVGKGGDEVFKAGHVAFRQRQGFTQGFLQPQLEAMHPTIGLIAIQVKHETG